MKQMKMMNSRVKDRTGDTYGNLIVVGYSGTTDDNRSLWLCKCVCGNEKIIMGAALQGGHTKSCGCLQKEVVSKLATTHGYSKKTNKRSEYRSWQMMKSRCLNKNSPEFPNYGGRGITVCERWVNSFENFLEDMGDKPTVRHSIDRFPNKDGNYEPSNCRWATDLEQVKNRSYTVWVDYEGEIMTAADFKRKLGIKSQWVLTLLKRMTVKEVADYYKNKNKIK
jgi:hypothetical protein